MMLRRITIALVVTAVITPTASTALAASPTLIQPGAYTGRYIIAGVEHTGPASVTLPAGTYTLETGASVPGSSFLFTIDGTGQVSGISNPASATATGNTLTLHTTNIVIDPVAYTGRYFLSSHFPTSFTGQQTVNLVPGLTYYTDDGSYIGGPTFSSNFLWSVDALGQVTNVSNAAAATATGATLMFKNATIIVDPSRYLGPYIISAYAPTAASGRQGIVLVPGLEYSLDTGAEIGSSAFSFAVDGAGLVSTTSAAALGSGTTLALNNVSVTINPASYTGLYRLSATVSHALASGVQTVVLVPALSYTIDNGSSVGGSALAFALDAAGHVGAVTPPTAATGAASSLVFGNVAVSVDPGTYAGTYLLGGYQSLTGRTAPVLIPDLLTVLAAGAGVAYVTPRPTGVTPPSVTLTVAGQPQTFTLSIATGFDPTTTTGLTSSPDPSGFGQPVQLTAFVNSRPGSGTPTGTVGFFDGATQLGSAAVTSTAGSMGASLSLSRLAVGAHTLTARYSGDTQFAPSTSLALTQTVATLAASTFTRLTSSPNPSAVGAAVTLVATVRAHSGNATPTGVVEFFDGQVSLGLALLSGGTAAFTTSALAAGSHVLTTTYLGDSAFAGSTSRALTQRVR